MPSAASLACTVLLALGATGAARADALPPLIVVDNSAASVPDDRAVQKAIAALQKDPLMGGMHREQRLHWRKQDPAKPSSPQPWMKRLGEWIIAGAQWLAGNVRALLIVATVVGAAMLAVLIARSWRRGGAIETAEGEAPPTHVRGLDIRPDELPEDVARAARHVWERGDQRGAMILLYRALLSRLVHRYHAAIRDSSTEGDCLRQAARTLTAAPLDYVSQFIACWQRAMYAAIWPEPADFEQLCAGFDAALPMPPESAAEGIPALAGA
ncbi:MAG TPA: DUF4129 domain-containing protein [Steroidobacteraceae bacterium]|nr:DUF4129 domain-containing protein [Steroidobacteraceae bacterium]